MINYGQSTIDSEANVYVMTLFAWSVQKVY